MEIVTERLVLREFRAEDVDAVLAYQSEPGYLRFYEWDSRSRVEAEAFVGMFLGWQAEEPRRRYQLAITLRDSGALVGNCGVRMAAADAREADFGCELAPAHWGRGYATEAGRGMLAFAFGELGVHRVWAECVAENEASVRMLERLGMRREGRLRENRWFKGRWWDTLVYGVLEEEWGSAANESGWRRE